MRLGLKLQKWAKDPEHRPTRYGFTVWIGRLGVGVTWTWRRCCCHSHHGVHIDDCPMSDRILAGVA